MKVIVSVMGAAILTVLILIYLSVKPPTEDASANAQRILNEMALY